MKKIKCNSLVLDVIKGALLSVVISLICILIFAFFIKTLGISDKLIAPINQVIKFVSIFFGVKLSLKKNREKGFLKGLLIGFVYTLLAFVVFSILSKNFCFDMSLFNDALFGTIAGIICGVIGVNIKKKTA